MNASRRSGQVVGEHDRGRPTGAIQVRPARRQDLAEIGEITARAYIADALIAPDHWYVNELRDATSRFRDAELLVAADAAGRLLGTVTLCLPGTPFAEIARPGEAEFRMLAVDPAGRRRGVGVALVEACIERAGTAGCYTLVLSTSSRMKSAHRLYERLGFVRDPSRDWSPEPGVDLLAYLKGTGDAGGKPHS